MITLKALNSENLHYTHKIYPGDEGKFWVNFNWYWTELSSRRDGIQAYLIYLNGIDEPVGFTAYGRHFQDRLLKEPLNTSYEIYHLIIDSKYQGNGIGRAATIHTIKEIHRVNNDQKILVACHPDNVTATKLYKSLKFSEIGKNYDDDPLYSLEEKNIANLNVGLIKTIDSSSLKSLESWEGESKKYEKEFSWNNWELGLET